MLMRMDRTGSARALAGAFLMGAALLVAAAPVRAQDTRPDARWQAWLGCWEQAGAPVAGAEGKGSALMCVLPVAETPSAVDLATVVDREIVARTRIDASGERHAVARDGCTGWESARWSADARRVYLRSELTCTGEIERGSNGILAMTQRGEWLNVQGITVAGNQGVRVARYREAQHASAFPAEKAASAGEAVPLAVSTARLAMAAPLTTAEVIDAARALDAPVVEAWLTETGQRFEVDARQLVALDDARVPGSVIDLMVAISYPEVFAIDRGAAAANLGALAEVTSRGIQMPVSYPASTADYFGYSPSASPFGLRYGSSPYGYGYGNGYGYGYGWYPGYRPVVVVVQPSNQEQPLLPASPRPRVVNGRGYTEGNPRPAVDRSAGTSGNAGRTSAGTTSTGSGTSSSGSSTSAPERTAKPRSQSGGSN